MNLNHFDSFIFGMDLYFARMRYGNIINESDEPPPNTPKLFQLEMSISYKPAQWNRMSRFICVRYAVIK